MRQADGSGSVTTAIRAALEKDGVRAQDLNVVELLELVRRHEFSAAGWGIVQDALQASLSAAYKDAKWAKWPIELQTTDGSTIRLSIRAAEKPTYH